MKIVYRLRSLLKRQSCWWFWIRLFEYFFLVVRSHSWDNFYRRLPLFYSIFNRCNFDVRDLNRTLNFFLLMLSVQIKVREWFILFFMEEDNSFCCWIVDANLRSSLYKYKVTSWMDFPYTRQRRSRWYFCCFDTLLYFVPLTLTLGISLNKCKVKLNLNDNCDLQYLDINSSLVN